MPIISRNSLVVLVTGNGSVGTGSPRRSQMGSQPSAGSPFEQAAGRHFGAHAFVVAHEGVHHRGRVVEAVAEPVVEQLADLAHPGLELGRHVVERQEDRVRGAPVPRFGVSYRQQHECCGVRGGELPPERAAWPVHDRSVARQHRGPVDGASFDRVDPGGDLGGIPEDLGHVVRRRVQQLLQSDLE
jgi:hypothetical protein